MNGRSGPRGLTAEPGAFDVGVFLGIGGLGRRRDGHPWRRFRVAPASAMREPRGDPSAPDHIPGATVAGDGLVARGGVCTA